MTASMAILGSMALILQQMSNRRNARGILLRTVLLDKQLLRVKKKRNRKKRSFWIRPGRSSIWWENIISGQMFIVLRSHMRKAVNVEVQLAAMLYYLAGEGRLRKVANAFGLAGSTVSVIIRRVR